MSAMIVAHEATSFFDSTFSILQGARDCCLVCFQGRTKSTKSTRRDGPRGHTLLLTLVAAEADTATQQLLATDQANSASKNNSSWTFFVHLLTQTLPPAPQRTPKDRFSDAYC